MKTFSKKIILILISFALLLTALSYFFVATDSLSFNVPTNGEIRGFPSHFVINYYSDKNHTNLSKTTFQPELFALDWAAFLFIVLSLYQIFFLIKTKQKKSSLLLWITFLAIFMMSLSISNSNDCVSGFPISYVDHCGGASVISTSYYIFGTITDLIFWLLFVSIIFSMLYWFSRKPLSWVRYLLAPLFLTLMSFFFMVNCSGFICIFDGNGFPLGYYRDGGFIPIIFLIDFVFLAIIYFVVIMRIRHSQKRLEKGTEVLTNSTPVAKC